MNPVAFLSYAHKDNVEPKHKIPALASQLERVVQSQMGLSNDVFKIFADNKDLKWGEVWKHRIGDTLDEATFLIPVLSPNYFDSPNCLSEFETFYDRLSEPKRKRQILPLLYRDFNHIAKHNRLAAIALDFQYVDWRQLRGLSLNSQTVKEAIESLAERIFDSLQPDRSDPWRIRDIKGPEVEVHSGAHGDSPAHYYPKEVLASMRNGDRLFIIGRTCHSWFFSSSGPLSTDIEGAITRGARLTFVVQDLYADALATPVSITIAELTEHLTEVEEAFKAISKRLKPRQKYGLRLLYTSLPIQRSRVLHLRHAEGGQEEFVRLQYDLSMKPGLKPFVVVRNRRLVEDVIAETEAIVRNAMTDAQFHNLRISKQRKLEESLRADILAAWQVDTKFSTRRRNQPIRLVRQLCAWMQKSLPPPLCVQILVSNRCSTNCQMCNYFGRASSNDVLSSREMQELLADVRSMGTRSVVFSGGEPLAREDLSGILEFTRSIGLRIGLLTNGVFPDATDQATRNKTLMAITESCEWMQVSVDSLEPDVYTKIRTNGKLDAVRGFLKALVERQFKNIDVCFTIQKGNYRELMDQRFFDKVRNEIPSDVYFRFKFAHATGSPNDGQFLIPKSELDRLHPSLAMLDDHHRTNKAQIARIMTHPNATEHIARGTPMRSLLDQLAANQARCRIMESVMFVDCNGDVYPCCYTFNDNVAQWNGRSEFRIGSWRDLHAREPKINALRQLWEHESFGALRKKPLPIHPDACARCTRHLPQNEFLYRVQKALDRYSEEGGDPRRLEAAIRGVEDPANERYDPIWL